MANDQTWQIIATPRERWYLAGVLCRDELKCKGKRATELWRFRCALGLVAPTEALLGDRKGDVALAADSTTRNLFTVTPERVEFLDWCLEQLDVNGGQLALFQRVTAQLQDGKPSGPTEDIPAYDESKEDWTPTLAPLVQQPGKLWDILLDCAKRAKQGPEGPYDGAVFVELIVEEGATMKAPGKTTRAEA